MKLAVIPIDEDRYIDAGCLQGPLEYGSRQIARGNGRLSMEHIKKMVEAYNHADIMCMSEKDCMIHAFATVGIEVEQ